MWLCLACVVSTYALTTEAARDGPRSTEAKAGGVLLWSHGRTASSTFCATLKLSSGLRYCDGGKEAFTNGATQAELSRCMMHGDRLTHVKPKFVDKSEMNTTGDFMRAAKQSNVSVVVATYRDNELANELSRFELRLMDGRMLVNGSRVRYNDTELRHAAAAQSYCRERDLVDDFMKRRQAWQDGVSAALRAGLSVKYYSFFDVTRNLCECVEDTLAAVGLNPACTPQFLQTNKSHRNRSLKERVGEDAAACLRDALDHPDYSWMLENDVARERPPSTSAIWPPV